MDRRRGHRTGAGCARGPDLGAVAVTTSLIGLVRGFAAILAVPAAATMPRSGGTLLAVCLPMATAAVLVRGGEALPLHPGRRRTHRPSRADRARRCDPRRIHRAGAGVRDRPATHHYFDRTAVHLSRLDATDTRTACPYKGRTTEYRKARVGDTVLPDAATTHDLTTAATQPIAGLIGFHNKHLDTTVDGEHRPRPSTPFS